MHTKIRERSVKTFLGGYDRWIDVNRSGGVFDAAEELVDRVGLIDPAGMDAETDDEVLAGGDGFGDMEGEINSEISFGKPTVGAVANDLDAIAEKLDLAGAVAADVVDLIVATLDHCDELVGRHVGDRVERVAEDFDFRRRENGKQCPAELLGEDRNGAVVLGDLVCDLDLAALAAGLERAGDGIARAVGLAVLALRKRRFGDDG